MCVWYEDCLCFLPVECSHFIFIFIISSSLARVFFSQLGYFDLKPKSPTSTPPAHGFFGQSPLRFLQDLTLHLRGAERTTDIYSAFTPPLAAALAASCLAIREQGSKLR
jgi:hypothetical protein